MGAARPRRSCHASCCRHRWRRSASARPTRRSWRRSTAAKRSSSARSPMRRGQARSRPTTRPWSPRCGTWCGRDTSPTTRSPRCGCCSRARPAAAAAAAGPPPRRSRYARYGRPALPTRAGPPTAGGRWWRLPDREPAATRRLHAVAEALLDRHGVLTRGAVAAEQIPGGFSAVYPVLSAFEDAGRCRRGYFVEGLGAAQFAVPGAVDRMRALAAEAQRASQEPAWSSPVPPSWEARDAQRGAVRPPVSSWPPPIRPTLSARHCPGPIAARRAATGRVARPGRSWCWWRASW